MLIVFLSNYYTHHQSEFSNILARYPDIEYKFIETEPMDNERKNMGWTQEHIPSYVVNSSFFSNNTEVCQTWIDNAAIVIVGSAPYSLIEKRLKNKKLTFLYSERIYKAGCKPYKLPIHFLKFRKKYRRFKNIYLLCASAYTAADYAKTFTFLNKAYKWGYFPEIKTHENIDKLIELKQPGSLLWVARFIDWKHPEIPVEIAKRLKADGYTFTLNMIGNGELEDVIRKKIVEAELNDYVHLLGSMKPEEVRIHMEASEIFLFTSDRGEGWGAVLNESMNSACAVAASHAIGSVPFLLNDGKNGLIYKDGDLDDLYAKVKWLMDHPAERKTIAKNAYETMIGEWNAETAASKFITLAEAMLNGEKNPFPFENGICSKAEIISDRWYKPNE